MKRKRTKKILLISLSIVFATFALLVLLLSPLVKYFLEKYDRDLFGRELRMDWAYVNPFTGYVHLHKLKMFEANSDSIFISTNSTSGHISLFKLLSRTVKISHLTLKQPNVTITQKKKIFNIDDLITKFTPSPLPTTSNWQVEFVGVKIADGEFHFIDKVTPVKYFIRKVNIDGVGKLNQGDTIATHFSFASGIGTGDSKGDFTINTKTNDYHFSVKLQEYDMDIIRQYIWELINYGMFKAYVNANLKGHGNFNSQESIAVQGRLTIRDFHLGKTLSDDYIAFKKMVMVFDEFNPAHKKYIIDSAVLIQPFIKYEIYDSLDNIERLFGAHGSNISDVTQSDRFNLVIEIARYIRVISTNFFRSDYKINRLEINKGFFRFNDYSLSEEFSVEVVPFSLLADSVNKHDQRVQVSIQSGFHPYGKASVQLSINPRDSADFDMNFNFEKIPASIFNPYLITYTSFPLDRGTIELNGKWKVRNGIIESNNHLVIVDPRVSKRLKNKNIKWLPMPLIMALIREEGNVIDYDIPITGHLKKPKFHLRDILLDLLTNLFVKPATIPYRNVVKTLETEIEKTISFKWELHQHILSNKQVKFVEKIAGFLKDHSDASMSVHPITYADKEKEHILFFETKKKYFMLTHSKENQSFSAEDSIKVEEMSVKDPALLKFISPNVKHSKDTIMFTVQDKCLNFIGDRIVAKRFDELVKRRSDLFKSYFKMNGTDKQIKIHASVNDIPYGGFSYFKLGYENEIPEPLRKAYLEMTDLNNERPRIKYKKFRAP